MEINLSAEMLYGLYRAAKKSREDSWNCDKKQFDLMADFINTIEDIAQSGIPRIIEDRLKSVQ